VSEGPLPAEEDPLPEWGEQLSAGEKPQQGQTQLPPGLYVVGTPIGHLGDITRRAALTLAQCTFVVAEDTRRTRQLLSHLGIGGKAVLCIDAHAGERELGKVLARLKAGESCAMVTDAGMPSVSDPGSALVSGCRAAGLSVTVIPGPSAVTAALAASGLGDSGFWFVGFLPRKGDKRTQALQAIAEFPQAVVLFESAQRLQETLTDFAEIMPERQVCVARELTKQFEEVQLGSVQSFVDAPQAWRGEVTLVLGPQETRIDAEAQFDDLDLLIRTRAAQGQSPKAIAEALAPWLNLPRRVIYQRAVELSGQ
jgi:16S rRNA (cytidine1402-2'-O)-methyltransferase